MKSFILISFCKAFGHRFEIGQAEDLERFCELMAEADGQPSMIAESHIEGFIKANREAKADDDDRYIIKEIVEGRFGQMIIDTIVDGDDQIK